VVAVKDARLILRENKIRLPTHTGLLVTRVFLYSPADKLGLQPFDVVVTLDEEVMRTTEQFQTVLGGLKVGEEYAINVYRRFEVDGKRTWRNAKARVAPVTMRQMYLGAMHVEEDEVREIEFWRHRGAPARPSSRSNIHVYFAVQDGKPLTPQLRIQYVGRDWLFIKRYIIKVGDKSLEIHAPFAEVKRDNAVRTVWEWFDCPITAEHRAILDEVINSDKAMIRCIGDKYHVDREISEAEKEHLHTVLAAYRIVEHDQKAAE
jgi:hypothetical protein